MFFELAVFYVAFILVMPTLAALPARDCAAEVALVFYLLTIFGFLLALQLEEASGSPIRVRGIPRSTFFVRRTTVEKIRDPFAFGGGGLLHVFQLTTTALTRVRVVLRRPPSTIPLSRLLPSQMLAQILVHVRVIFPLHGQFNQEIDQIIVGVVRAFLSDSRSFSQVLGGISPTSQR